MKHLFPSILYFIAGPVPTAEEAAHAETFGPNVRYRNASVVPEELSPGSIEKCDGVAGSVPKAYSAIKKAEHVVADFIATRAQRAFAFATGSAPQGGSPDGVGKDGSDGKGSTEQANAKAATGESVGHGVGSGVGPTDVAKAAAGAGWPATLATPGKGK